MWSTERATRMLPELLDFYQIRHRADRYGDQPIRCPSVEHEDRRPSASLNLEKEVWHCAGCGRGGGALHLIAAEEGYGVGRQALEAAVVRAQEILGDSCFEGREEHPPRRRVAPGSGFRPSYRNRPSTWRRGRPDSRTE